MQAGGGEKKRLKEAADAKRLYTHVTLALYIVYFTVRVLWQFSSLSKSTFFGLAFLSAVNYLCLTSIFQALALGTPYSAYQDVLFINWAVMALSLLTSYAWLLWLTIPAYVLWQYGGTLWQWVRMALGSVGGAGGGAAGGEQTEAEKKRLAKKERQADRAAKLSGSRG